MKKTKFLKWLPVMLALMLISPAMAEGDAYGTRTQSSVLNLTLPYFTNITTENQQLTSQAKFDSTYSNITGMTETLKAGYQVITNAHAAKTFTVTATAPGAGANSVLYKKGDFLYLVFTNSTNIPDATSVTSITSPAEGKSAFAVQDNPNAIAFKLTESAKADTAATQAATDDPAYNYAGGTLTYTLTNGIYHFLYTVGTTSETGTFSTHDTEGTYQATITITDTTT